MEIYKITNTISGKVYIGATTRSFKQRYTHRIGWWKFSKLNRLLKAELKSSCHLGHLKYKVEIIYRTNDKNDLFQKEKEFIAMYNSIYPYGYNLTYGGETGILTEEALKRLSANRKGIPAWNKGKKGIYSKETLKRISESGKGREPPNKGKKVGPMPRHIVEKSAKAHYKPVKSINENTGEQIIYESMLAVKKAGFHAQMVRKVCNGKQSHHKKLKWEWL